MTHYCSSCGGFSWHRPGTKVWAVTCPACGHVERQRPHREDPKPTTPAPATPARFDSVSSDDGEASQSSDDLPVEEQPPASPWKMGSDPAVLGQ